MKRKRRDRLYFFWSVAIFACLLLALFSLILVSCSSGDSDEPDLSDPPTSGTPASPTGSGAEIPDSPSQPVSSTQTPPPPSETPPPDPTPPPSTELAETEDMGEEYVSRIIFLGDSTTYGLGYYNVVPKTQVWTPSNGTFSLFNQSIIKIAYPETSQEISIEEAVTLKKPEMMVITLGVNGVAMMTEDAFKSDYSALVKRILEHSPDTKIILNSIYPVAESYAHQDQINNEKIDMANGWVCALAEELGVRYINSGSVLKGEDGFLPESYTNGTDGMHLNEATFDMIINYIRTHGYR